jgi:hypothetical protein
MPTGLVKTHYFLRSSMKVMGLEIGCHMNMSGGMDIIELDNLLSCLLECPHIVIPG